MAVLALAVALTAAAGAQEGVPRSFTPFDSVVVDTAATAAGAAAAGSRASADSLVATAGDSLASSSPGSLAPALADSLVRPDSLASDSTRQWRVSIPAEDSIRAKTPLDRSAWITWTPRISHLALPLYAVRDGLFAGNEPWQLKYPIDARTVSVAVDPAKGTITQSLSAADVGLDVALEVPIEDYARDLTRRSLRAAWITESRRRIANVPTDIDRTGARGPFSISLPFELPRAAQGILGRGGPSLNVSGSERISIAGTSNWDNRTAGLGVKRSLFPSLDMRQDLDIKLNGSLGDKVRIDVAQNSANTVPLANRIGIRYTGYEDEILKTLELGNTNLSLPGTQYVSYSGRNEGLFGVKAGARIGGTDLALIASKQEGRSERKSFQGTQQEVVRTIDDLNYVRGKYFFIQRPAEQLATGSVIEPGSVRVYLDDKNGSNNQGVRIGTAEVDPTRPPGVGDTLSGSFDGLRELTDFQVKVDYFGDRFPVLVLRSAISNSQLLAVTYIETLADGTNRTVGNVPPLPDDPNAEAPPIRLKLLQAPRSLLKARVDAPDYFETDPALDPLAITRDYEIKSFYDLQSANIDPKSLSIQVRRYDAALEEATDAYKEGTSLFPYIRVMGIDLFTDNGSGAAIEGPDLIVDQITSAWFLETETGVLYFPDLRPFDPRVTPRPDATPEEDYFFRTRIVANNDVPGLRGRMFWPAGVPDPPGVPGGGITPEDLESNPKPYDKRNLQLVDDRRYYIWAKFAGTDYSGTINLGQVGILDGSEVVAIEGVPLEKNKDYQIDYEAGVITLLTAKARENRSRLSIDYSYAPLFAQAGKTLVGGTLGYRGPTHGFGGAFIYESKGQDEARPRLGEEPTRTLIGDLYGDLRTQPRFLTDLVDRLPFYNTTEPSQFDINGEIGMSMPNPNTKNTVYLDDFEGNRDSYSAPMGRGFWKWAAPPLVVSGAAYVPVAADYNEMVWYNPVNTVQAWDLNPRLTRGEGGENYVTVLDMYLPKLPAVRAQPDLWSGFTTTVEPDGSDFSRLQYLEVWVNDWRDMDVRSNPDFKLHIDLGVVSEDAQRAPGVLPNAAYDTEDRNRDGKYDPSNDPAIREDTGADGIPDELEAETYDLSTASDQDRHGDNFRVSDVSLGNDSNVIERLDPQNYVTPTLSEKSKGTYESGNRLFTEDLDGNQELDRVDDYMTFTLPLGDEAALAPFLIFAAESTLTVEGNPVAPNNGWRRFRIPLDISDPRIRRVINGGSLANVKHMRVWMEGFETFQGIDAPPKTSEDARGRQPLLQLGAVEVVGNRWRIASTDSATRLANGSVVARNVNNQEDRNIYDPPFGVATSNTGGSTQTQREQSIALEVTRLPVGSAATIFKDQTYAEDYTRYGRIGFYATAFGFTDQDSARFFLRLGYDDRNYYEYSRPFRGVAAAPFRPTPWTEIILNLTDFTDVKLDRPPGAVVDTVFRGEEQFVVVGSPTFTRIQRMTIGVFSEKAVNDSTLLGRATNNISGQVWIDDLRALDVDRSRGTANRLTVYTRVADLMTLTTNWDRTDENFQRLGQARGSDVNADRLSLSGTIQPHRFLSGTGLNFPMSFAWAKTQGTPRLRTGTDLFLRGDDAINEQSRATDRSFSVGLSKTGDRNPILRNTIGRASVNFAFGDRVGRSPTGLDSSRTLSGGGGYSLAPAEWFKVPVPLWKQRGGGLQKIKLLPETATISFSQTTTRSFTYKRGLDDPVGAYSLQSDIYRKTSLYLLGATWRPLPLGSYTVAATRNAYIPGITPAYVLGVNFGRMTNFTQRLDGRLTVPLHAFVRPAFDFSSSYSEARTPDLSPDLSLGSFNNATNAGVTWELPFARLASTSRPPTPQPTQATLAALNAQAAAAVGRAARASRDSALAAGDSTWAGPDSATAAAGYRPPPPPVAPSRGFSLPVGRTLSRLGNVSMRISFARTTGFSRFTGVPSVPYRLGLVRDPDTQWNGDELTSIYRGPQATENAQRNYSGDASTTVQLVGRSTARIRANYSNLNRNYNSQVSNSSNFTFPDLQLDWGQVHNLIRLGKVFTGINASSRASFVRTLEGVNLEKPSTQVRTKNFRPLLQLSGQTRGTANVQLSIDQSSSIREDFATRRSVRKEGETSVRSSISRSYMPGQKMPIFGSGLKSTLTMSLDGTYSKRSGSTESQGQQALTTRTDRLDLNSSATYSFSTYVTGTLGLGFSQNRDLYGKTSEGATPTNRSIRLEASGSVRF